MYDFLDYDDGMYFQYNPLSFQSIRDELEKCIYQFKKEILPIFEFVQTEKNFLIFEEELEMKKYGEEDFLNDNKLYINLRYGNYSQALMVVEAYIKQKTDALTEKHRDEFDSEEKFQAFLDERLQELNALKNAIQSNDVNDLDQIVQTNINHTKNMLRDYGFTF
ncbi:hypothetical protein [Anoxybacteroides tepidamans]|uniref:hypothetical protein n=1 Tax=Anoxybacteroides tepidamans TaxID=265948 RepID=UPI0004855954|nr:hypothetical protein [Anoxybacillus tepidamans]